MKEKEGEDILLLLITSTTTIPLVIDEWKGGVCQVDQREAFVGASSHAGILKAVTNR